MVNYENGKIYKIVNDELNLTYYGSTTQQLSKRKAKHKCKSNDSNSKILFTTETKPEIFLVELFPCNTKEELLQRERFYIENNECINKNKPILTDEEKKEYVREMNNYHNLKDKDLKKKLRKEKYKLNKNEILKELKKKIICECGAEISKSYKYQHIKTKKHIIQIAKCQ